MNVLECRLEKAIRWYETGYKEFQPWSIESLLKDALAEIRRTKRPERVPDREP